MDALAEAFRTAKRKRDDLQVSSVCVIIPCYKDAATLSLAVESVLAQTCLPEETIVVNDCSPESSQIEEIMKGYPSVQLIKNESNLGLAATRSEGVKHTSCEVVSFLDADDELHPQKIEKQLAILKPGVAISCAVRRIGYAEHRASTESFTGSGKIQRFDSVRQNLVRNRLTGASLMVHKSDLLALGGYDPTLKSCEDFDLWLRLLEAGMTVYHLDAPLYLYRVNPAGLSRNTVAISGWEMEVVRRALGRMGYRPPYSGFAARVVSVWVVRHILRNRREHSGALRNEIAESVKELSYWPWRFVLGVTSRVV